MSDMAPTIHVEVILIVQLTYVAFQGITLAKYVGYTFYVQQELVWVVVVVMEVVGVVVVSHKDPAGTGSVTCCRGVI